MIITEGATANHNDYISIQGSNDNANWISLSMSVANIDTTHNRISVNTEEAYKYYRLTCNGHTRNTPTGSTSYIQYATVIKYIQIIAKERIETWQKVQ